MLLAGARSVVTMTRRLVCINTRGVPDIDVEKVHDSIRHFDEVRRFCRCISETLVRSAELALSEWPSQQSTHEMLKGILC